MHPRHHDRIQPPHDRVQLSSTELQVIAAMDERWDEDADPRSVRGRAVRRRLALLPWWLRAVLTGCAAVLTALAVTTSPLFGIGAAAPLLVVAASAMSRWACRDHAALRRRIHWRRRAV